ncbi:hypothetical protein A2U01_0083641, partial [Trifolium medium]|nr:hypothetical protein [Trifolium medium]
SHCSLLLGYWKETENFSWKIVSGEWNSKAVARLT